MVLQEELYFRLVRRISNLRIFRETDLDFFVINLERNHLSYNQMNEVTSKN